MHVRRRNPQPITAATALVSVVAFPPLAVIAGVVAADDGTVEVLAEDQP